MAMTPAQAATFLYQGLGWVYVTGNSGTFPRTASERMVYPGLDDIGIPNVSLNRTLIEMWGRMSIPANADGYATFTVEITTSVASNCTAVTVGGVNQLAPVAMVPADNTASAAAIAAAINAFVSVAPDYSATSVGNLVIGRCNVPGSAPNGGAVTLSFSVGGNAYTSTPVAGGRTTDDNDIRIWIDIDPLATETTPTANWVDITDWVNGRAMQSPKVIVDATVVTGTLTVPRKAQSMIVRVSGPTALSTIDLQGAVDGDELELVGVTGFSCNVLSGSGNIITSNTATVPLTTESTKLFLEYSLTAGGTFTEQTRSSRPTAADLRSLGISIPLQEGVFDLTPAGGTMTITPGQTGVSAFPGVVFEHNVVLTANVALGASLEFAIDTADVVDGDTGTIFGNSSVITLGANAVNFSDTVGVFATLPEQMALSGQWQATWMVMYHPPSTPVVTWNVTPVFSDLHTQFLETTMYQDLSVTNAKIADDTIDGDAKLVDDSVTEVKLDTLVRAKLNVQGRNRLKMIILTADVLTLNTIPVVLVPAPGAGKAILVEQVTGSITYAGVVYATNVNLQVKFTGGGDAVAESALLLVKTTNSVQNIPLLFTIGAAATQILENTELVATVEVGDPTAGTSDIALYIDYSIIDL